MRESSRSAIEHLSKRYLNHVVLLIAHVGGLERLTSANRPKAVSPQLPQFAWPGARTIAGDGTAPQGALEPAELR
jgi:hypothetical protein